MFAPCNITRYKKIYLDSNPVIWRFLTRVIILVQIDTKEKKNANGWSQTEELTPHLSHPHCLQLETTLLEEKEENEKIDNDGWETKQIYNVDDIICLSGVF